MAYFLKYWDFDHDLSHEMADLVFLRKSEDRYALTVKISFYIFLFEQEQQVDICMVSTGDNLYSICAYAKKSKVSKYTIAQEIHKNQVLNTIYNFVKSKLSKSDVKFFNSIADIEKYCQSQNKKFFHILSKKYVVPV